MVFIAEHRAEYNIILSLPGIGPNIAVRLMAEIGSITLFSNNNNNKHLNAYAGINILLFQSDKTSSSYSTLHFAYFLSYPRLLSMWHWIPYLICKKDNILFKISHWF